NIAGFGEEETYLSWLEQKMSLFPEGFVLVKNDGEYVGQLELTIREYEGRNIGYINLYYLTPEMRGQGIGKELHRYAIQFFQKNNVTAFHLRVSPTNIAAINFYHKLGMEEVGVELDGKVIRMRGHL